MVQRPQSGDGLGMKELTGAAPPPCTQNWGQFEMRSGRVDRLLWHEMDCTGPPIFVDANVREDMRSKMSQGHPLGDGGVEWIR